MSGVNRGGERRHAQHSARATQRTRVRSRVMARDETTNRVTENQHRHFPIDLRPIRDRFSSSARRTGSSCCSVAMTNTAVLPVAVSLDDGARPTHAGLGLAEDIRANDRLEISTPWDFQPRT